MSLSRYERGNFGSGPLLAGLGGSSPGTFAMATLNTGWAARFIADTTLDIYNVWLNWATIATPGTVTVRIETDASGKPSGTLYDANAAITGHTPVAGWDQVTFASHPTTGLIVGNTYYLVVLTDAGGTTMTLRDHLLTSGLPTVTLTAVNGTTRTNFAEANTTFPIATFGMSDGSDQTLGLAPWPAVGTYQIFGTNAYGMTFTVSNPMAVVGAYIDAASLVGTPTGGLRAQIFNSGGTLVSGCTATGDVSSLKNVNSRHFHIRWPAVTIQPGTYTLLFDQTDHASTSGNRYQLFTGVARVAGLNASGFAFAKTTDITASPVVITDPSSGTEQPECGVFLGDITSSGGGPIHPLVAHGANIPLY